MDPGEQEEEEDESTVEVIGEDEGAKRGGSRVPEGCRTYGC